MHEKLLALNMYALALIEVANVNDNYLSNNTYPLPSKWALYKMSHSDQLTQITLPTLTQSESSEPVKIVRYQSEFSLVSGVNKPKVFKVLCTDGRTRRQLVKGRDDPRQDAVMQQIFQATNCILGRRRKRLTSQVMQMRTYKVVSLSKQCGAIEWCEGTTPVNPWLVMGHQRYRPDDLKTNQAMSALFQVNNLTTNVAKEGKPEKLLAKFKEVWHKIGPVFGFFFLERFPNAADWHRAKNIYATSLAVSSIVGYVVGLGDRHTNNILVDLSCGELIHIDLGIAFDQGKCLPTPELVPFRLTRDFEQALGPKGVEICLHPIAEQVLETLQSSGEVIVTLLQVLLHDPLYAWCLTPSRLLDLERRRMEKLSSDPSLSMSLYSSSFIGGSFPGGDSSNNTNQLARKVIITVRERLQPPAPGKIGVSAQIEQLLGQARSYENLSRMYYGWQSYM
ncbi:hypothetical protein Ciccas_000731 [Cichlidogyrus casuarinus]|uniref:non-specific serine/threonine protein kinase n=1 Tax=Cichlidogyrus casuarinus TaxID=1844966 RepID=A0ABD2QM02_9PLAT